MELTKKTYNLICSQLASALTSEHIKIQEILKLTKTARDLAKEVHGPASEEAFNSIVNDLDEIASELYVLARFFDGDEDEYQAR